MPTRFQENVYPTRLLGTFLPVYLIFKNIPLYPLIRVYPFIRHLRVGKQVAIWSYIQELSIYSSGCQIDNIGSQFVLMSQLVSIMNMDWYYTVLTRVSLRNGVQPDKQKCQWDLSLSHVHCRKKFCSFSIWKGPFWKPTDYSPLTNGKSPPFHFWRLFGGGPYMRKYGTSMYRKGRTDTH